MALVEINFDGIVGPSHNYAGLSVGNLASSAHAGAVSSPRAAALQGLAKMRGNLAMGLPQGFLVPLPRPNFSLAGQLGLALGPHDPALAAAPWSASAMWTANAATVSPAPDAADGRCHLTPANLSTMLHRAQEWPDTARQLALAFADPQFAIHDPMPPSLGDEGAANHMRMGSAHDAPGIEIFVYGRPGGRFPARQHEQASRAIARLHRLDPARTLFAEQSQEAIAAGAFHNDVVAVANERVLLCHEQAFAEPGRLYADIIRLLPGAEIIVVPTAEVPLADAVASYLFNAQLCTLPDGTMTLIVPSNTQEVPSVQAWLSRTTAGNGPIRQAMPVDLAQSMANGGGPACLRLRVVCDPATVDPRFVLDGAKADRIAECVTRYWPERIAPDDLGSPDLAEAVRRARQELLAVLDLAQLG